MTKREIKKQQKQQKLEEKIVKMSEKEYLAKQGKLANASYKFFATELAFAGIMSVFGVAAIFTLGTSLLPLFVGIALSSLVGIGACAIGIHVLDNKRKANSSARVSLVSIEEIEEKQKHQTQEIINRIKKERETEVECVEQTGETPSNNIGLVKKCSQVREADAQQNPVQDEIVATYVKRAVANAEQGPSNIKHYASLEQMIEENGYMGEINE